MEEIIIPEKIRLKFSVKNCVKSFYYKVKLKFLNDEANSTSFSTEEKKAEEDNSLIKYNSILECDYYFYKLQNIEIKVTKIKLSCSMKSFKIGNETLTLSTIILSKNGKFETKLGKNTNENFIIEYEINKDIDNNLNIQKNSFLDYIKAGIEFKLFVAIDYFDNEYHKLSESKNPFLLTIRNIRQILNDFTRTFEVYGFGNNLIDNNNKNNINQNFFNLNKDNDTFEGYTAIHYAYYEMFTKIKRNNDSIEEKKLSPLLEYLLKKIMEQKNPNEYNIIFILINSLNENDFLNCIDTLIKASFLPLSFVFIGIGDNDEKINIINKLSEEKKDQRGNKKIRNNTNFIHLKEKNFENEDDIYNDVLKKIPEQLCEFYFMNKVGLNEIKNRNINNKNSLIVFDTYNSLLQQIKLEEKDNAAPSFLDINKNKNNENIKDKNDSVNNNINISINVDTNNNVNNNVNNNTKSFEYKTRHHTPKDKYIINPNTNQSNDQKKYKLKNPFKQQ